MVWPTSSRAVQSDDRHGMSEPPANPKPARDDPWGPGERSESGGGGGGRLAPDAERSEAHPGGPAMTATRSADGNDAVIAQLTKHLCDRVAQCGNLASMNNLCGFIDHVADPLPANCAAARRCLDHVDSLSCTASIDDPATLQALLMKVPDCIDAIHC
jgi:hypothetical protein